MDKYCHQQSSNFFLSLLENSTDLISIIDAEGYYKFVSGSVKSILGYVPEELVGLCAYSYIHEEDLNLAAVGMSKALDQKVTRLPNFRFRTKTGEWRWLECTITNMVNNADIGGYVSNSRDVTDRVLEEQRNKKNLVHYESLFYNHPDAVFELDRAGFICKLNRQMSVVTGFTDEQIIGSHFKDFVYKDYVALAMEAFTSALAGKSQYLELSIIKQSGELAFLGVTVVPVVLDNLIQSIQCIAKDITINRKFDALIKEQAEQLNSIMERVPEAFYSLDSNWCYTYVNNYYASYLGMRKEALLGRNIWELFPGTLTSRFYRECMQVAHTGMPASFDEYYPNWNGTILSMQIFPTGNGVSVHLVDVTRKKREQDKLEKLSLVASKTTTCVMVMDAEQRIEWVNEAFEQVTGYSLPECYLKYPGDILAGQETEAKVRAKIRKKLKNAEAFKGEILNYTKSGQKVWFYLELTPVFNEEGKLSKFISIRTDITEKKVKEEELMQVTRDLFKQNRDLQQFSYMVSHNLRAPAANVIGLTNILSLMDKNSSTFAETLNKIKISAGTLDGVIRDMNHILSIRGNNYVSDIEKVNILAVCEDALAGFQLMLNSCPHQLSIQIDKNLTLWSNRDYLFQILKNLFSNAIKFRKEEEVLKLQVQALCHNNKVELLVKDNGVGMDMDVVKDDLYKIYKRFHKGFEGRGIGLFLTKAYVDALGGSIHLDSAPEKGTTFRIKFKNHAK